MMVREGKVSLWFFMIYEVFVGGVFRVDSLYFEFEIERLFVNMCVGNVWEFLFYIF